MTSGALTSRSFASTASPASPVLSHVLERDHGYRVPRALAIELSQVVQTVTDARGDELSAQELGALFEHQYFDAAGPLTLESADVERRHDGKECAIVAQLLVRGERREARGIGKGPVEAFVAALSTLVARPSSSPTTPSTRRRPARALSALAYVAVQVEQTVRYGAGRHEDVLIAAFRAVVSAYNRNDQQRARRQFVG